MYRYGHQDGVTGVDSLTRERAITSGGRDCSVRIWKVIEESQLVFHATSYVSPSLARWSHLFVTLRCCIFLTFAQ